MALGKFADDNLALGGAISGGTWAAGLPLANLLTEGSYISAPARCTAPGTIANSKFDLTLSKNRAVNLVGVLFHTLSLTAKYRLSLAPVGGSLAAPAYVSPWTNVYGRMFASSVLPWEAANWWTGEPTTAADLALYPRHLWIPLLGNIVTTALRLEFDDASNAAGFIDIGGLWVAAAWSPVFNYDWGSDLSLDARDVVDEAPSGRLFSDERDPRRKLAVTWSQLTEDEQHRLFDAGARARTTRSVLFAPDTERPTGLIREAFPAMFDPTPAPRKGRNYQGVVRAGFKEIIA